MYQKEPFTPTMPPPKFHKYRKQRDLGGSEQRISLGRDEQNNILLENPLLPDIRTLNCGLKQSCYYGVKAKVAL